MTLNLTNITIPGIANITGNYTCSSVEECQALIEQLQKELEKVKQEKAELEKQIQYLQQQLNITQTEKKQLEEQIKILQQALEERNKKIRELEQIIAELEKEKWSWETAKEKAEEQYLLWTPYLFPVVLGSLLVYYRRYKKTKKYAEVMIDQKARELKEELLSEYLKKDILRAKIESIVDDPNLLVILRTIIPQLTGSQEITKGDILAVDIEKVAELARKRFLLKENRVEYLKKKLAELKEEIKEEVGGEE
jgi:cell division protein FtsB